MFSLELVDAVVQEVVVFLLGLQLQLGLGYGRGYFFNYGVQGEGLGAAL